MTIDPDRTAPRIRLVDPSGAVPDPGRQLAPRLADIRGKVVGLVGVTRDTMERIGELLVEQHGAREYLFRQKPEISLPCPDQLFDELAARVDCLVVGVGVWGSCTSYGAYDAVMFESAGLPAALIVLDTFESLAAAKKRQMGLPELRVVTIPGPMGDRAAARAKGDDVLARVVEVLVDGL